MAQPRPQARRCAIGSRTAVVEQSARGPALLAPERLASGAGSLLRHGVLYAGQLISISLAARRFNPKEATGASPIPPSPNTHLLPRHAGAYLGLCAEVDTAVAEATCVERQGAAAVFANLVTSSSLAPTNVLLGNPAALKRAFESGGASLVLGLRNYLDRRALQRGMPSQVKQGAPRVGEDLAVTSGAVVYRDAVCEVIQLVVAY
jgi:polyhydroxyalkanoate synthase